MNYFTILSFFWRKQSTTTYENSRPSNKINIHIKGSVHEDIFTTINYSLETLDNTTYWDISMIGNREPVYLSHIVINIG